MAPLNVTPRVSGTRNEELLSAPARLSTVIAGLDGTALTLSTEGQHPQIVAERIRDAFPDALRPGVGSPARVADDGSTARGAGGILSV
jgi:hypothetical protein